jgi:hypothetical protein
VQDDSQQRRSDNKGRVEQNKKSVPVIEKVSAEVNLFYNYNLYIMIFHLQGEAWRNPQ